MLSLVSVAVLLLFLLFLRSRFWKDMLFHEYRIESRAGNEILFEAKASLLLQSLNSGKTAPTCQIKLAKRAGQPCLSIETRVSRNHTLLMIE